MRITHVQTLAGWLARSEVVENGSAKVFQERRLEAVLPSPDGRTMPCSSIQSANKGVDPLLSEKESASRGRYQHFTEEDKAVIAKRACEVGVTNANAVRALAIRYPGKALKESTVRTWMNKYIQEGASGKEVNPWIS